MYYRCGNCNLNLPHQDAYKRCVRCNTPTASMQDAGAVILTELEATALARKYEFERFLEQETEGERTVRRSRTQEAQRAREARSKQFEEMDWRAAGFADWEIQRFQELEADLGRIGHN